MTLIKFSTCSSSWKPEHAQSPHFAHATGRTCAVSSLAYRSQVGLRSEARKRLVRDKVVHFRKNSLWLFILWWRWRCWQNGLGAHEQGSTENIKVQIKNNTVGLGATKDHEDNWIAHQDEFNQLLSELNVCHKQNGSSVAEDKTAFSLEEKSKSSKKRVHYQKFTKGKDLSSRSAIDLACIFGKRGKQVKGSRGQEEQVMSDTCFMPDNDPEVPGDSEPKVEINTVTSSLTMQEYFANRMAQLKKPKAKHEIHQVCATQDLAGDDESSFQEVKRKRKKCSRGDANRVCNLDKQPILSKQAKSGEYVEINNDLIEDSSVKENCRSKKSSRKNSAKLLVSFDQKVCPLEEVESMIPVDQYSMVNESSEMHNEQECREDQNKQKKIKKVPYLTNEISQSCHDSTERRKKKIKKQKC
ncbi:PIN2/TERF1-interacting telomerase inhibitor 1 isoform X1 [Chiloscyllium plagiosum]|uniref:PIN2/TERF1-interacting telomerase inhibitor 1 isoform X1 n=1 Tax=Chiloscyllium plagiosum TaxID=36176 RepID=UPI001CB852E5|nr:PIN2/TERF1-interacting telomerase inhibitor 1 isoform X1 [Chiloscyllium plagiosum]